MNLIDRLETASEQEEQEKWSGTFREFLRLFETGNYPNMGVLSHQRVYSMIMDAGTEKISHFGEDRFRYGFFEDTLFGIEESVDKIMSYLHGAAQRTETSKRMLLLFGPPSSGKSELVTLIKRGLESYTRTDKGAIFALKGTKMHENPFVLIPYHLRADFEKDYGLKIEGSPSPMSRYTLENTHHGKFMDFPVEQIFLSEADRIGIGTWLPSDAKSQDISELVGGIDFAKIQETGSEADPRSYNFDGEFNVANRGIMEYIEGLKCVLGDSLIATSDGFARISDLHGADRMPMMASERVCKVSNGFSSGLIIKTCYKGEEECVKVTTSRGYEIKGSIYHRVLVHDGEEMDWVKLGNLKESDNVVMSSDSLWTNTVPNVPNINSIQRRLEASTPYAKKSRIPLSIGSKLTTGICRLLGYFVAEGSYLSRKGKNYGIRITTIDSEMIDDVNRIAQKIGLEAKCYDKDIHLSSVVLCNWFDELGLGSIHHASEKFVPDIIWKSPKRYVAEFLSAYFDGDGTVTDNDISCASASSRLIREIQILLLNFGIVTRQSSAWNKLYQNRYYCLTISSDNYDMFLSDIGFNLSRKQKAATERIQMRINHRDSMPLESLFRDVYASVKNISCETGRSIAPKSYSAEPQDHYLLSRKTYNDVWAYSNGTRMPSRRSCHRIAGEISRVEGLSELAKKMSDFISTPIFFDTVKSITPIGVHSVFDVHETSNHSYACGGFINHNSDERFLRANLTVTQEKSIKAPRFGLIYCDTFIIMHSNEEEFKSFMKEKKYEAYHDRMVIVPVRYNLGMDNEVAIYKKLLGDSDALKDMHIAPKTIEAAAMFAVLSRLEPPPEGSDLTIIKKMKLYNNKHVKGHKIEQVPDLKKKSPREGMAGVSPRFIIDQIVASISAARDEDRDFVTALDILKQLNRAVDSRAAYSPEQKTNFKHLLDVARKEWNSMLQNDIQKAFFLSFDDEARDLCNNYLDQIEAVSSGESPRDPITGEEKPLDESLMENIEDQIGVSSSGREDFRNEILRAVAMAARHDKKFDYTQHASLKEAIQKQLFAERKNVIRMTTTTRNPDADELKKINEVVNRMVEKQGYSASSANELLKYATSHLFEK